MTGNYETYDIVLHFSLADQELVREFEHHIVRLFKKPGVTTQTGRITTMTITTVSI